MLYMFQFPPLSITSEASALRLLAPGCSLSLREKDKNRARSVKSLILDSPVIPAIRHLVAVVQTGFECLPVKAIQSSQRVLLGRGTTDQPSRPLLSSSSLEDAIMRARSGCPSAASQC
jgi:hypothetical protein